MFETYQTTLMRDPDSMLAIRFSGRHDPVTVDGAHFFDRDPKYFDCILNYLRDGNIAAETLPKNTAELHKIRKEADYYQLSGLQEEVEKIIQQSNSNTEEKAKTSLGMGKSTLTKTMKEIAKDVYRSYNTEEMEFYEEKVKSNKEVQARIQELKLERAPKGGKGSGGPCGSWAKPPKAPGF
ncbi:BTB/POZ domain-containing protein KCTD7-like [Saccostrea cucullata]|uniref:BTB/POZ domain-containing protein KCTD7-like n=1 Tax=Saccostrea cuccullata TaxID=36930 RepID=UPI002ED12629